MATTSSMTPAAGMTSITDHESQQVHRANTSGLTPVVFVHGLWLLPSSWDRWAALFEEAGYSALTPGWPDDPETVAEANAHPDVLATVDEVTESNDSDGVALAIERLLDRGHVGDATSGR